jgi:hypothetical protein
MFPKLRSHVRHHLVGYVALFIALGPSAYATHSHLTQTRDIADNAVTTRKIAPNAIGPGRVLDNSLTGGDIRPNSVGSPRILDGSLEKRDFKAGELPQGAIQFNFFTPNGGESFAPYANNTGINGLHVFLECNVSGPGMGLVISSDDELVDAQVTGIEAADDVVRAVHRSENYGHTFAANTTQDLQVLARNVRVGKWTHFAMGAYNGGSQGCNFWGVVTPPSN